MEAVKPYKNRGNIENFHEFSTSLLCKTTCVEMDLIKHLSNPFFGDLFVVLFFFPRGVPEAGFQPFNSEKNVEEDTVFTVSVVGTSLHPSATSGASAAAQPPMPLRQLLPVSSILDINTLGFEASW